MLVNHLLLFIVSFFPFGFENSFDFCLYYFMLSVSLSFNQFFVVVFLLFRFYMAWPFWWWCCCCCYCFLCFCLFFIRKEKKMSSFLNSLLFTVLETNKCWVLGLENEGRNSFIHTFVVCVCVYAFAQSLIYAWPNKLNKGSNKAKIFASRHLHSNIL